MGGCYVNSDSAHYQPVCSEWELTGFGPGGGQPDPAATVDQCVCARTHCNLLIKHICKSHPEATTNDGRADTRHAMTSAALSSNHGFRLSPNISNCCWVAFSERVVNLSKYHAGKFYNINSSSKWGPFSSHNFMGFCMQIYYIRHLHGNNLLFYNGKLLIELGQNCKLASKLHVYILWATQKKKSEWCLY